MTPDERYARCEPLEEAFEGGATYTNNPKDRGGPTKFGITLVALSEWRGRPCTADDVKALQQPEVRAIYRGKYWDAVKGDQLPAGVDLIVFDAAVNTGRGRAAEQLQTALRLNHVDRIIGSVTLLAVASADPVALVEAIRVQRQAFYRSLDGFPTFGRGWLRRLSSVAHTATAWAGR